MCILVWFFSSNFNTTNVEDFNGIQTRIDLVEDEWAVHLTTTTAKINLVLVFAKHFVKN